MSGHTSGTLHDVLAGPASGSSCGLSCGLPGLSPEVAGTISNFSTAESIAREVSVSALTMKDWLMRSVPLANEPSMTSFGVAVHNAHVDTSQLLIGGLLEALEARTLPEPEGLPRGMSDFQRGVSRADEVTRIVALIGDWLALLIASQPEADVMHDPRTGPFLDVLQSEARRASGQVRL
jgi:hypothetical protein